MPFSFGTKRRANATIMRSIVEIELIIVRVVTTYRAAVQNVSMYHLV